MKKRRKIAGPFIPHPIEMLRAPAWRVLSLTGYRILARIEIELGNHGGRDNGELPVTYSDFHNYGIHRHAIGPGLREVKALGFVDIKRGVAGNAEFRQPNLFRLTYQPTKRKSATNDWRKIKTVEEAQAIASAVRSKNKTKSQCRFPSLGPVPVSGTVPPKTSINAQCRKPSLLSRYLAIKEGRGSDPPHHHPCKRSARHRVPGDRPVTFHRTNKGGHHGEGSNEDE